MKSGCDFLAWDALGHSINTLSKKQLILLLLCLSEKGIRVEHDHICLNFQFTRRKAFTILRLLDCYYSSAHFTLSSLLTIHHKSQIACISTELASQQNSQIACISTAAIIPNIPAIIRDVEISNFRKVLGE